MSETMQTYRKKKIEIMIEAPALRKLIARLNSWPVSGYSVLPVLAGKGHEGQWEAAGMVGDTGRMVAVICIVDAADVSPLLDDIFPLILRQIGIVTVCDVEVIRPGHF